MIAGSRSEAPTLDWHLLPPPRHRCLLRNLSPLCRRHLRRPSLLAPRTQLGGGALSAGGFQLLGFLAGRNPHDFHGVADHVSGALLASGSAGHLESPIPGIYLLAVIIQDSITIGTAS
jgi:hypothetical protein